LDSSSGCNLPSGEQHAPDTVRSAPIASRRFRYPLPIDPIRLFAGVLTRWRWILIGMLIMGTLGAIVGMRMTSQTFALSSSLIKRRVPQTVQASETGQAFRPVDLNDATLLATLLAGEPHDMAAKRADNGLDSGALKRLTGASQLEGTDIFYITYHSPISPDDAIKFSEIWAQEINAYTKRLQQTEARDVRAILEKEVASMERKIEATNREILDFSRAKDFFGGEAQVTAVLGKLFQIELELEEARTSSIAKKQQLETIAEQIRHQSPIELQIKIANEELANLRSTYTDENPLVQAKIQSIEYLDTQIKKLKEDEKAELDAYTGTPLGNQLYLTIVGLRNELIETDSRIVSLDKMRQSTAAKLADFPAIISGYNALQKKRDADIEGLSLMSNRLKEAEIFASGAPGYWQIFQAPDSRSIIPSSLIKKPAILGLFGAIGGAGIAVLLTLFLTQRTSRRSILECCSATKAPLICHLPTALEKDARAATTHFWFTYLAPRLDHPYTILFWTVALDPIDERRFWTMLAEVAEHDTGKALEVLDLTPDSLWLDDSPVASLSWQTYLNSFSGENVPVLVRASSLPQRDARAMFSEVDHWISVVFGQKESLRRAVDSQQMIDAYLSPCDGTIAWTERPKGKIREMADVVSCFIAKKFS
jgi:uncharacterized protein involved in exopolysaccharide biosynthesis